MGQNWTFKGIIGFTFKVFPKPGISQHIPIVMLLQCYTDFFLMLL